MLPTRPLLFLAFRLSANSQLQTSRLLQMRVMTFNIRNGLANDGANSWAHRKHLTAQVIRDSNCDIIGLQEVYDFQLAYLLEELPDYTCYSIGREDGVDQGEHCSILWRKEKFQSTKAGTFWLSDAPDVPNSMTWENRNTRICSWVEFEGGFRFYNTHWDHESQLAREKSAELLLTVLPSANWLLLGDFNAEPDSTELATLGLKTNFISRDSPTGTFHNFEGGNHGDRIDHLFTAPGLKATLKEVILAHYGDLYPSDHYPVVFEVTL